MKPKLDLVFLAIGCVIGMFSLLFFKYFPQGNISLSIVSGTTLSIGGFRFHHWLIGGVCLFLGWFVKGKIGSALLGFGLILLLDDLGDL